jgi:hypothetical protein
MFEMLKRAYPELVSGFSMTRIINHTSAACLLKMDSHVILRSEARKDLVW